MRFSGKKGSSLIEVLVASTLLIIAGTSLSVYFAHAAAFAVRVKEKGNEMDVRRYIEEFLDCPATFAIRPPQCDLGEEIEVKSQAGGALVSPTPGVGVDFPGFKVRAKCLAPGTNSLLFEIAKVPTTTTTPLDWRDLFEKIPVTCDISGGGSFSPPTVIKIPLECAHVVFNSDLHNKLAATYPGDEKNCKISFDLTDYYPPALNQIFSKIEVDFKVGGWYTMAPDLGEGYFTDLGLDSSGNERTCEYDMSSLKALNDIQESFIPLSSLLRGFYYSSSANPSPPLPPGAGSKETDQADWESPLFNGVKHMRFRVEYTPTAEHRFYFENKWNGWGSCSFTNGCGACMSNIKLKLYR